MNKARTLVPQWVKNIYHFIQAAVAAAIFGYPSKKLKIIGVTGTDGKTTTVELIYHILKQSGAKVSMVSTVRAVVGEAKFDTGFHVTTPSPFEVQKFLSMMVKAGSEVAVLEVTSHGLHQNRVAFVDFHTAVITNITNEHLDYHKNYESYLRAKAKILENVKYRILNQDDSSFRKLADVGSGKMVSYGLSRKADYFASAIKYERENTGFKILFNDKDKEPSSFTIDSTLVGEFNVYNILASVASLCSFDIEKGQLEKSIRDFAGIEGRMEKIEGGQDFDVIVDFAHTPNSFESTLHVLRQGAKKKLICVFGSAGERDKGKRPIMGGIAAKYCDFIIVTGEDPRNEDVRKISDDIAQGIKKEGGVLNQNFWLIPDRAAAIREAIQGFARSGDTVAILGKGHEKSMNIEGREYTWSDQEAAKLALAGMVKK